LQEYRTTLQKMHEWSLLLLKVFFYVRYCKIFFLLLVYNFRTVLAQFNIKLPNNFLYIRVFLLILTIQKWGKIGTIRKKNVFFHRNKLFQRQISKGFGINKLFRYSKSNQKFLKWFEHVLNFHVNYFLQFFDKKKIHIAILINKKCYNKQSWKVIIFVVFY